MEEFVKINNLMQKILSKYGISLNLQKMYDVWERVVGKKLAKKIQLCGIKGDTLLVTVETPIHHHYLKLHQKQWLQKINDLLSSEHTKDTNIEFRNIKVVKL